MSIWDNVNSAEDVEFKSLPDGEYEALLNEVTISEKDGQLKYKLEFVINEGEFHGRKTWLNTSLPLAPNMDDDKTKKRFSMFKRTMKTVIGDENATLSDDALIAAKGNRIKIALQTKPGPNGKMYTNVYAQEFISNLPF